MKITDFDVYQSLLKEESGLVVTQDKSYLLESRLNPVVKKWNFSSIEAMTISLQGVPDKQLVIDIVEAMTTNETSFFRDFHPFKTFEETVLPCLVAERAYKRKMRIWSAASSSGQEPYSLAMLLKEQGTTFSGWNMDVLATDISNKILQQAHKGIYSQFEVQHGLPIRMLVDYFEQYEDSTWQIKKDIRNMVEYGYFNLLSPMTELGQFDVIFCRNVLTYFDDSDKKDILDRMAAQLAPDGFLFLGNNETVLGITDTLQPMPDNRGLYVKKDSPHLGAAA